jgi:hypothetical protein
MAKENQVGFHQEYNQDPGPRQDLNPDVVSDSSVLPAHQKVSAPKVAKVAKAPRVRKSAKK